MKGPLTNDTLFFCTRAAEGKASVALEEDTWRGPRRVKLVGEPNCSSGVYIPPQICPKIYFTELRVPTHKGSLVPVLHLAASPPLKQGYRNKRQYTRIKQ